ncbi:MAG: NCS2 family permease [Epsilonproteobacteria bacterium]|nr:NCS2 family permease [Campylobacterota bacterium]
MNFLQRFELEKNGTSVSKEFIAGMTTFFAMLYIIPVNATILSAAGMPFGALVTATTLMTIIATLATGLWANTPIAMSVGMGLNAFFTYGIVLGMNIPWQTGLGIVFLSGILYLIIALTHLRAWIINTIPLDIKRATSAGIGAFIAFIGLKEMGVIVASKATLVTLGNLSDPHVLFGIFGLLCALVLSMMRIKAALILSIVITTLLAWISGVGKVATDFVSMPASVAPIAFEMDIASALSLAMFPLIITFLVTDIFDTIGTLIGVGLRAKLFKNNDSKELQKTMEVDAAATVLSGAMGVTSTTAFIESAAGVEEGGRTGLTSVFTALFFLLPLFLLPFFEAIPSFAIYPIIVVVGSYMFSELRHIDYDDAATKYATFFIVLMMPLTYSITNGLMIGAFVYVVIKLFQKEFYVLKSAMGLMAFIAIILFFVL